MPLASRRDSCGRPDLSGRVKCRAGIMDGVEIVDFGGIEKIVGGTKDMV